MVMMRYDPNHRKHDAEKGKAYTSLLVSVFFVFVVTAFVRLVVLLLSY